MWNSRMPNCGCYIAQPGHRAFTPLISVEAHTIIHATASRTRLTQRFLNPHTDKALEELRYIFPLYDGISIVSFVCTIGDRVIRGVIHERDKAKSLYDRAVESGKAASLLQQSRSSADVFSTSIGNVPAGAQVTVVITYLVELKHDAAVDGLRFTLPTHIAPRYGEENSLPAPNMNMEQKGTISIVVDADMPEGCPITSVQSPSHPISVQLGRCSSLADTSDEEPSLHRASASLSLGSAELNKDFVLDIVASKLGEPSAVLETHSTLPAQQAILATIVPRFNLVSSKKPEIVFVCDRSGSMGFGRTIPNLKNALHIFLRSLPVGVKFNICSFGSRFDSLWETSKEYDAVNLKVATEHVARFDAGYGGTEMYEPLKDAFDRRDRDRNLEVFLLTDGDVYAHNRIFEMINENVASANGAIRVFTLGIGQGISHALIEGVARAGNGFAQSAATDEKLDNKVIRMLKSSLSPHINEYSLEVKYSRDRTTTAAYDGNDDDDFVLIGKPLDSLTINPTVASTKDDQAALSKVIPLRDSSIKNEGTEAPATEVPAVVGESEPLPELAPPKYLQTPCPLSNFHAFNRTTVYVLLSDTSASLIPMSVILTGKAGPDVILKQEIPVAVLPGKGTMIHQLAARKEVSELEEGRGWLPLATDTQTGRLLKERFSSQFADLTKQEAVRICLRYQVAGAHCSFVAVESAEGDGAPVAIDEPALDAAPEDLCEESDEDMGFGLFDGGPPAKPKAEPAVRHDEGNNLQKIASLQSFAGSWSWDDAALLEGLIGVTKEQVLEKAKAEGLSSHGENHEVLATLCALIFLKTKLVDEKDAWEMMAEKAVAWVKDQLGGEEEYHRWERAMRGLL